MYMKKFCIIITVFGMALAACNADKTSVRQSITLADGWKLWRDVDAKWSDDSLYLADLTPLSEIAKNAPAPTGGWAALDAPPAGTVDVILPASVEEYLSGDEKVGTKIHGVFWFWKDLAVPSEWQGKAVSLNIESYRLRAEIFVNGALVGYDIVGDIPYSCDVDAALKYGSVNRIAIRITNPGGNQRGWEDYPHVVWGNYALPASRDFGGLNGRVEIVATEKTRIRDIFVKNMNTPDFRTVEVSAAIQNLLAQTIDARVDFSVTPADGGKPIYEGSETVSLSGEETTVVHRINCPDAVLWAEGCPSLYHCRVRVAAGGAIIDEHEQRFGFRVFEVRQRDGNSQSHLYLNGKRIILKSAIDFSYYAGSGSYPPENMAEKSVAAVLKLGQNTISMHRRIGHHMILEKADEHGVFIYEEPGGFHSGGMGYDVSMTKFTESLMMEKFRRMIIRDRSHPALLAYNLSNEDRVYNDMRERALHMSRDLDGARLAINSSGGNWGGYALNLQHVRPYERDIRTDLTDHHTVLHCHYKFVENDFEIHRPENDANVHIWGEVIAHPAPENYVEIAAELKSMRAAEPARRGYNGSHYFGMSSKAEALFNAHKMSSSIKSPADIFRAAAAGKMYNNGRSSQIIMSYNGADAYAVNAWSGGNGLEGGSGWCSGLLDDARNIKGDNAIYRYFVRPLQIAVMRREKQGDVGGKFFDTSGKPAFRVKLINQGVLPAGQFTARLRLKDGAGKYHPEYQRDIPVSVAGGDIYAQDIDTAYAIVLNSKIHGGFVSIEASLLNADGNSVADGVEYILLSNRQSFADGFANLRGEIYNWSAARKALADASAKIADFAPDAPADYIVAAGSIEANSLTAMLKKVNDGARLLLRFDSIQASELFAAGILSEKVSDWGAPQSGGWNGNGFGFVDCFSQEMPFGSPLVSLSSWETANDLNSFSPFASQYKTGVYGIYHARPEILRTIIGTVEYGKGLIILHPSLPVDSESPFNDFLFYNLLTAKIK